MIEELFKIWEKTSPDKKIMVITGSGVAFDSQFNKKELWEDNLDNNILTKKFLLKDPNLLWKWVLEKRELIDNITPNINHLSIVKLEECFKENFILITHNIDGLHKKAGNYRIIETRGNIFKNKLFTKSPVINIYNSKKFPKNAKDQILRPDIVLTGEEMERKYQLQAHVYAQQTDILLIIGSKLKRELVKDLPLIAKKMNNAKIIEINSEKQYCDIADFYINMKAENFLPLLINIIIDIEKGIRKNINY